MSITALILFFSAWEASNETGRFRWQGDLRGTAFLLHRVSRGEAPLWAEKSGARLGCSGFLCGEASNETGRFRGGGIQRGPGLPWHTILLARSSVLYLLRRAATEGACDGAAQGPFGDAGQAGFAGRMAENAGACEKQSPPGRQRMRALGWSEAEEKCAQPGCRRYIKTLVPRLSSFAFFHPPCICFFRFSVFDAWLFLTFFVFGSQPI